MFARFARFISRHWIWVLVAWIVLAVGFRLAAPRWDEITQDGDFAYLPQDARQRPRRRVDGRKPFPI